MYDLKSLEYLKFKSGNFYAQRFPYHILLDTSSNVDLTFQVFLNITFDPSYTLKSVFRKFNHCIFFFLPTRLALMVSTFV